MTAEESLRETMAAIRIESSCAYDEIRAEFESLYPNAKISQSFIFEMRMARRREKICAKCDGTKCLKSTKTWTRETLLFGELMPVVVPCANSAKIDALNQKNKNYELSKIPKKYLDKVFEDYEITAENTNAVKWAKSIIKKPKSLYISGSTGVGKTLLMTIVAQEYLNRGRTVIFSDVPSLLNKMRHSFSEKSETDCEKLMEELKKTEVLVLDDLGAESTTDWAIERLYLIINDRYELSKQILVTSNYSIDELAGRMNKGGITGNRIASRLREMCKVAKITGTDYRLRR